MFQDKQLICEHLLDKDTGERCGKHFVWTKGEQAFMQDLFENGKIPEVVTPRRCRECRLKKKQDRNQKGLPR